ncbi:MAG: Crp/Fnr family transcriptional regulator [Porphyrobacter sp.]|nr:Crp/Fnr family transcriptional regulator [Porphyrobacter sp.]
MPLEIEGGHTFHRPGEEVGHVQFPTTAVVVLGIETLAGESVNVALLGPEGAVGVFEACGSRQVYYRATVQFGGTVWQAPTAVYRSLYIASGGLRSAVHKYVETLLVEARQNVACNALHTVENRLARTLLETADKFGSTRLPITQGALAHLLGVEPAAVAAAIAALQRSGCLRTGRGGGVEVLDAQTLAVAACSCRDSLAFVRREIQSRNPAICDA